MEFYEFTTTLLATILLVVIYFNYKTFQNLKEIKRNKKK